MGPLRFVVITKPSRVLGWSEGRLITPSGSLKIEDSDVFLCFGKSSYFRKIPPPKAVFSNGKLQLLLPKVEGRFFERQAFKVALRNIDISLRVAKHSIPLMNVPDLRVLMGLLRIQPLLTDVAFTVFLFYCGLHRRLGDLLNREVGDLRLYEALLLPAVSYCVLSSLREVMEENIEPYRTPTECLNLCLSYLMSSRRTNLLLGKGLADIRSLLLKDSDLSKAHGGLSAYSRKL